MPTDVILQFDMSLCYACYLFQDSYFINSVSHPSSQFIYHFTQQEEKNCHLVDSAVKALLNRKCKQL